jgi:predicted nucleic acid-binding protein
MIDGPVFIDVNIPMYAAGTAHPYRESCTRIITAVATGKIEGFIDTEIVQEILHRYGALGRWSLATSIASNVLAIFPNVLPVIEEDITLTVELASEYGPRGVRARDLIHAAVMRNHQISTLISTDSHFDQIPGIERIDPLNLV